MDTYKVKFTVTLRSTFEVEASSAWEAREKFNNSDTSPLFEDLEDFPIKWTAQAELIDWEAEDAEKTE